MVAKAKVRIEGEDATAAAWNQALGRANKASQQMARMWKTTFAGISLSAIAGFAKEAIDLGDSLNKAAIKAGIGGKAMSELAYAAKLADVEVDLLSTSIKKMQVNLSEARTGGKSQVETLHALGLEIENIKNLKADQQFEIIADRISRLTNPADRARAATEMFGKAGADLLPLFEQGAEGIRKAREEAEQLGLAFDDEKIKKMADADDAIKRLHSSWTALWVDIVAAGPDIAKGIASLGGYKDPAEKLADEIDDLEDQLREVSTKGSGRGGSGYRGGEAFAKEQSARIEARIEELKIQQAMMGAPAGIGGRGRGPDVPGFEAAPDPAAARAAARAEEERIRNAVEAHDRMAAAALEEQQRVADMNLILDEHAERMAETVEDHFEHVGQAIEELDIKGQIVDTAEVFTDVWNDAFDTWQHNGELTIEKLAKFMLMELGQRLISNMLNAWSSGGFAEVGNMLSGGFGALFGGTRDSGGRGEPGKAYRIGTGAQPEMFIPDSPGMFIPRGMGGGMTVAPVINIDARGATVDAVRLLPKMAEEISRATEMRIVERLDRGLYPRLRR